MFASTEAIKANPLVNYCYVVTKINLIYDFQKIVIRILNFKLFMLYIMIISIL